LLLHALHRPDTDPAFWRPPTWRRGVYVLCHGCRAATDTESGNRRRWASGLCSGVWWIGYNQRPLAQCAGNPDRLDPYL